MTEEATVLKILIIGESNVGKTCLLLRYTDDKFTADFFPTIGVDFKTKYLMVDGKSVKMQIWDTAGQDKFHAITRAYFRGAQGIMVVYDVTSRDTFNKVQLWIDSIKESCNGKNIDVILVGNKTDLEREVSEEEAKAVAQEYDVKYFETSAKEDTNVATAFYELASDAFHTLMEQAPVMVTTPTYKIIDNKGSKKDSCKC